MIALLVIYTVVASVPFALAAAAAERAVLLGHRPARWTWVAGLGATTLLPVSAVWPVRAARPSGATLGSLLELVLGLGAGSAGGVGPGPRAGEMPLIGNAAIVWSAYDRTVVGAWCALTGVVLLRLATRGVRTRRAIDAARRDASARVRTIGRARVLVTRALGPAVVGGTRATLVIPHWVFADPDRLRRRLVFAHEAEHARAGDPILLAAGALLVALAPWSPAGWWMLARLHAAVELDCDRRVLRSVAARRRTRSVPVAAYGSLLLDVAARHAPAHAARPHLVPALATPARSILERRIRQMTSFHARHARVRIALLSCGTLACVAVACELPRPMSPRAAVESVARVTPGDASAQPSDLTAAGVRAAVDGPTRVRLDARVGRTRTLYIVDSSGQVMRTRLAVRGEASSDAGPPLLRSASIAEVQIHMFAPGALGPDSVAVVWIRLVPARVGSAGVTVAAATTPAAPRMVVHGAAKPATTRDSMLVVIDGRVAGRGSGVYEAIPVDSIQSIDVLKGVPAAAKYGDAGRAGVIVVTRKHGAS